MHRKVGKDIMTALYAKLKKYNLLNANIIVQCFDSKALQDFRQKYNPVFPLVQLIGENEWLESADDFAAMKKADGIRHVATYAQGIGVWIPHLITYKSGVWTASGLAELAKNNGLMVHAYTLRPDALPDGVVDGDDYLDKIINLGGADGIFSDQPDILLK
jgi:glycerophosphoryl diester phosphodiesterase